MSIDLSLHRIEALLTRFNVYTRPTAHIAGTNGKGSVSALLTSIFLRAGLTVGRFNSPHLLQPSDSISLNGSPLSPSIYSKTMAEVQKKNEEYAIDASGFEVLTICALLVFERSAVDVVLLEVGMGGRLDATNVVPDSCIMASVITAIDLDHQAFLGPTVAHIAREKAGIVRTGRTVILAAQKHQDVEYVVREIAAEKHTNVILAPVARDRRWDVEIDGECPSPFSLHPFAPPPPRPVEVLIPPYKYQHDEQEPDEGTKYRVLLPLHGDHQLDNLGAVLTVLHHLQLAATYSSDREAFSPVYDRLKLLNERVVHAAIRECVWPGRLSFHLYRPTVSNPDLITTAMHPEANIHPPVVLVDGAHNEAAARTLAAYIKTLLTSLETNKGIRLTLIVALSHSPPKTPESVLVPLLSPLLRSSRSSIKSLAAILPSAISERSKSSSAITDNSFPASSSNSDSGIPLTTKIAFVRFSPPEDMPWVRSVPPSDLRDVVRSSFTDDFECWTELDEGVEMDEKGDVVTLKALRDALNWAAEPYSKEKQEEENLILIAGSLYLVADFYRLLQLQK